MTKKELIDIVKKANKDQVWSMIYYFNMLGFYREDKRVKKGYIISCLENCYDESSSSDKLAMQHAVISSL